MDVREEDAGILVLFENGDVGYSVSGDSVDPLDSLRIAPAGRSTVIARPLPRVGDKVIALNSATGCWIPAAINNVIPGESVNRPLYTVQFSGISGAVEEGVKLANLAYDVLYPEAFPNIPLRVFVKLQNLETCDCGFEIATATRQNTHYCPGILAKCMPNGGTPTFGSLYLIFLDNGQACLVKHKHVRMTCSGVVEDFTALQLDNKVIPGSPDTLEAFLGSFPWQRRLRRRCKGDLLIFWKSGKWGLARITERDEEIVKVQFEGSNVVESVFVGSLRFLAVFKTYLTNVSGLQEDWKQFDGFEGSVEKHDLSGVAAPSSTYDPVARPKFTSPLVIPLHFGWKVCEDDGKRTYVSPTGTIISSRVQLVEFLKKAHANLYSEWFSFEIGINIVDVFKPKRGIVHNLFCEDISFGQEIVPVQVVNTIDSDGIPVFEYSSQIPREDVELKKPNFSCTCVNDCSDVKMCECRQFGMGLHPSLIKGCSPNCNCRMDLCLNRNIQNGPCYPLQIFKTFTKDWAVRAMSDIPKQAFICEYVGELKILETKDAEKRGEYMMWLHDEATVNNTRTTSGVHGKTSDDELPSEKHRWFIDSSKIGNVGRFFNHSCCPNMYVQPIYDENLAAAFPAIAFFTTRDIKAGEELVWDYDNESVKSFITFKCKCLSDNCKFKDNNGV